MSSLEINKNLNYLPNNFVVETASKTIRKYIVYICDDGFSITDCSGSNYDPKNNMPLNDKYYAGFVVYATSFYSAIFQAGIKHNQLENS